MKREVDFIISEPEQLERFFPVGTVLIVDGITVEVVEDGFSPLCDGCPFDLGTGRERLCGHTVCSNKDDTEFVKFKKLEV